MSLLVTCSCSNEWIRDTLKELIENFLYVWVYWSHFHALMNVWAYCSHDSRYIKRIHRKFLLYVWVYWSHVHALMNGFEIHWKNSSKISIIRMSLLVTCSCSDEWIRDTLKEIIENFYYTYEFPGHMFMLWWMD